MSVKIVTGYTGENHITSADDQARNYAAFGASSALWDTNVNVPIFGTQFEATMQDATTLRIGYGEGFIQGVHFRIPYGEYVDLTIDPGQQGVDRHDVVVAHYTKAASTGVENVVLEVVKGTPGGDVPFITPGSIYAGDTDVREIMYFVHLNGITVAQIENELNVLPSLYTVNNSNEMQDVQIDSINTKLGNTSISSVGDGTVTGAISSLNSDLAQKSSSMTTYTPTITWVNGSAITVANISFGYARIGDFLFISGRFNITDKGSPGNTSLKISLPSGYTIQANPAVGCFGHIVPTGSANITNLLVRAGTDGINIYRGAGGDYSSGIIANGYYAMFALVPIA